MSSTSPNVCELWNGHSVERIAGEGKIQEFLLIGDRIVAPEYGKRNYFKAYGMVADSYFSIDANNPKVADFMKMMAQIRMQIWREEQ